MVVLLGMATLNLAAADSKAKPASKGKAKPAASAASAKSDLLLSIDLGAEYLKVGVLNRRPGYPLLDVALNEQSNRKTPTVVSVEVDGEIRSGEDGVGLLHRLPERAFFGFSYLLGEPFDGAVATQFLLDYPQLAQHVVRDAHRGTVAFTFNEQSFTVEHMIAFLLRDVRTKFSTGDIFFGEAKVKDAVLVVPEAYTPTKVALLAHAAGLAGLTVVATIPALAAAAIDYGLSGANPLAGDSQTVVIFGMGAYGAAASVCRITRSAKGEKDKDGKRTITVDVLATAVDAAVGGREMDLRVVDLMAGSFDKLLSPSDSVRGDAKAMAKLRREALAGKEELSVSPMRTVSLEKLHSKKDFKMTLTKKQLETTIQAIAERAILPVARAIAAAQLTAADITVIELFGGAVRVPLVQKLLAAAHPAVAVGRHLNGDEAACFGGAFYGGWVRTYQDLPATLAYTNPDQLPKTPEVLTAEQTAAYTLQVTQQDAFEARRAAASDHDDEDL